MQKVRTAVNLNDCEHIKGHLPGCFGTDVKIVSQKSLALFGVPGTEGYTPLTSVSTYFKVPYSDDNCGSIFPVTQSTADTIYLL